MNAWIDFVSEHPMYGIVNVIFLATGAGTYAWLHFKEKQESLKPRALPSWDAVRRSRAAALPKNRRVR